MRAINEELGNSSNISISIFEQLSFLETQEIVQQAKCSILLSEKEGGSKATTECLFLNVPIIIYEKHVGGSLGKVNSMTGVTSSFERLADAILFMSANYGTFEPRKWAIANTASDVSTKLLNEKLKQLSCQERMSWTEDLVEKVNGPNLQYKQKHVHADLESGYAFLRSHFRP